MSIGLRLRSSKKILAYWGKDVDQNDFLVEHRCTVPNTGREMQNITCLSDLLFIANGEKNRAALNQRHLFVRVIVRRCYESRCKFQAADHDIFTGYHLALNTLGYVFAGHTRPICKKRSRNICCYVIHQLLPTSKAETSSISKRSQIHPVVEYPQTTTRSLP